MTLVNRLREHSYMGHSVAVCIEAADHIELLEKSIAAYSRERDRFAHTIPEISGEFFIAGQVGNIDQNYLPEYIEICPAYGAGWTQLYKRTDKTITSEGG
jgi:hypothetical protein